MYQLTHKHLKDRVASIIKNDRVALKKSITINTRLCSASQGYNSDAISLTNFLKRNAGTV